MFKKKKKTKQDPGTIAGGGVLTVTVMSARNLSLDGSTDLNPYCVLTCSFNKQRFKSKMQKKSANPSWNESFLFYVSAPQGDLYVKVYDKDRWKADAPLGEVTIGLKRLEDGQAWEDWFDLELAKKKKSGEKGQLKLKLHYPMPEKDKDLKSSQAETPTKKAEPEKKKNNNGRL